MTNDRLQDDLDYVRSALAKSDAPASPAAVYFLWAAITLVGFSLVEFGPRYTGLFWMIAGPLGGVASGLLGRRAGRARGQTSSRVGRRHWLHWAGLVGAIFLLIPLLTTRRIPAGEMPRLVLLLTALAYFTGGGYLDRRLRWIAGAVAGCYLLTVGVPGLPHLWTVTAVILAVSFVACGIVTASADRRPTPADPA
jgi:hypothetical protein